MWYSTSLICWSLAISLCITLAKIFIACARKINLCFSYVRVKVWSKKPLDRIQVRSNYIISPCRSFVWRATSRQLIYDHMLKHFLMGLLMHQGVFAACWKCTLLKWKARLQQCAQTSSSYVFFKNCWFFNFFVSVQILCCSRHVFILILYTFRSENWYFFTMAALNHLIIFISDYMICFWMLHLTGNIILRLTCSYAGVDISGDDLKSHIKSNFLSFADNRYQSFFGLFK